MFGDLGKVLGDVGGIAGGMMGGPLGGALGGILGGGIGQLAQSPLGQQVWSDFTKDPMGSMSNPLSLVSKFADHLLQGLGVNAEFRTMAKFSFDPKGSIEATFKFDFGKNGVSTVNQQGQTPAEDGLKTNGKDTVDTGRYLISASQGEIKIFDKRSNSWLDASGDPHVLTSDGTKAQFQENITFNLEDGSQVKIKCTPKQNGVALIDSAAVIKGDQAVGITGFQSGNIQEVMEDAQNVLNDQNWSDGSVIQLGDTANDMFGPQGQRLGNKNFEQSLDGLGGTNPLRNQGSADAADGPNPMDQVDGGDGIGGASGGKAGSMGNVYAMLFAAMAKMEQKMKGLMKQYADNSNKMGNMSKDEQGSLQAQNSQLMFQIQQIQSAMQQITTMMTNTAKAESDTKSAIIKNIS